MKPYCALQNGSTALMLAAEEGHTETVKMLLNNHQINSKQEDKVSIFQCRFNAFKRTHAIETFHIGGVDSADVRNKQEQLGDCQVVAGSRRHRPAYR